MVEYIMTRYYDVVLALIPLALVGIGGALLLAGVQQPIAVSAAGTTAVVLIGHAIFVNGPVVPSPGVDEHPRGDTQTGHGPAINAD